MELIADEMFKRWKDIKNGRDLNRVRCELNAYHNLRKFGVCDRGFVPAFHGYMEAEIVLTSFIAYVFPASCTSYIVEDFEQLISLLMAISEGFISKALCEPIFASFLLK
jgi:hypothetical protein